MSVFTADNGAKYRDIGGVLRVVDGSPGIWQFTNDDVFAPDEITLVSVSASTITVSYPAGLKVVSFDASPDAHFASQYGATFGVDPGLDSAIIRGRLMTGLLYLNSWSNPLTAIHVRGRLLIQAAA